MAHGHEHPTEGCFGCHVVTVGYQGLRSRLGDDPVQKVPVVADDGARAGRAVGQADVHWDGRRDTTVFAPRLTIETKAKES